MMHHHQKPKVKDVIGIRSYAGLAGYYTSEPIRRNLPREQSLLRSETFDNLSSLVQNEQQPNVPAQQVSEGVTNAILNLSPVAPSPFLYENQSMEKPKVTPVNTFDSPEDKTAAAKKIKQELAVGETPSAPAQLSDIIQEIKDGFAEYDKHELSACAIAIGIIRQVKSIRASGDWKKLESNWKVFCTKHLERSHEHFDHMERFIAQRSALSEKSQIYLSSGAESPKVVEALSKVPEEKRDEVAKAAKEEGGKVTVKKIEAAAAKIIPSAKSEEKKDEPKDAEFEEVFQDSRGTIIPVKLRHQWKDRMAIAEDMQSHCSVLRSELLKKDSIFGKAPARVKEFFHEVFSVLDLVVSEDGKTIIPAVEWKP